MRLFLYPEFSGDDNGDGGVRRVVEAQIAHLPKYNVSIVGRPGDAHAIGCHITAPDQFIRNFADRPLVSHCHGLYWSEYQWEDWAYKANNGVLKLICSADETTAPSEWVAQSIRRNTSRSVRVVPHGIDLDQWSPPVDEQKGYVLWNKTRVDPVCEIDTLHALASACPDIPFVSTFAEKQSNIVTTGKLPFDQAKSVLQHAGAYLCTTRETFGIGTLEALACGVPIVGFNFGGQADIIEHDVDGWLVEPGDISGLREGINRVLGDRERFSKNALEKAKQFPWSRAVRQYAELYSELATQYSHYESSPRVTIVVTAYNLDKYLPACLDSILRQSEDDWECIIVDDASPDYCGDIADDYAERDDRFRVIHNEKNVYLAEARNVAIRKARGRYILPLDADDMLTPSAVEMLADELDADRTLSVAYGNVLFVNEDGETPTDYRINGRTPGHSGWPVPHDAIRQIQGWNFLPYSSMFCKSMWNELGGYRRRLRTSEDADFWTRAASYGYRAQMVSDADTLIYRNREGSMSRANAAKRLDYIRWFPWAADANLSPGGLAGGHYVSMYDPKIAVIVPVGPGHEQLVQDAIDSVAAQSFTEWECIVVNDSGSCLHLPQWVKVITSDKRDAGASRNLGIAEAKAKLFLPLDADDFLQPDALAWLLAARQQTGDGIIYPDFYEDPDEEGRFKVFNLRDWSCHVITDQGMAGSVVALTPVDAWRKVGGYAEGLGWEDWDFQLRLAEAGFCSHRLAAPLFTYRKHTGQRRWYDREEWERRKEQILARWRPYFTGEKQFMACGCKGGTVRPPQQIQGQSAQKSDQDAVLIEYNGARTGSATYRAPSKTLYTFASGDQPKWVLGKDADYFLGLAGFRVVASQATETDPVLTA